MYMYVITAIRIHVHKCYTMCFERRKLMCDKVICIPVCLYVMHCSGAMDPRCKICIFMGKTDPQAPTHKQQVHT